MTSTEPTTPPAPASRSARYLESLPPLLIEHVTPGDVLAIATDNRGAWRVAWRQSTDPHNCLVTVVAEIALDGAL